MATEKATLRSVYWIARPMQDQSRHLYGGKEMPDVDFANHLIQRNHGPGARREPFPSRMPVEERGISHSLRGHQTRHDPLPPTGSECFHTGFGDFGRDPFGIIRPGHLPWVGTVEN